MKIIAWSHNNEPNYQAEVRAFAKLYFSGHVLCFRNSQFFRAGEIEKADVIICKEDQTEIILEYQRAKENAKSGFDPHILTAINAAPPFTVPDPKEETKKKPKFEDLESPDLGFMPQAQGPALQASGEKTETGTLETGSLSAQLSSVLGDLGESGPADSPPSTPAATPVEEPKKQGKKKKSKGAAK